LNNLSRFWQELKRRKVVRVITVYAAAAFVILELVSIIVEPLRLPEWFLPMVIVLLCIGFIIAIILSWIYDVKPEGGIVKTEPAHKVKSEEIPKSSNSWKIASYISFVVIIGFITFQIISSNNRSDEVAALDKSIAVLPFINDSSDEENTYFINGTMESILNDLSMIKDLRVVSRTSVEQYRNSDKPAPDIAKEMKVNYILEGSGQKLGSRILLTVQLIDGINDHHLWSKQYDREIQQVEDLIDIQKEVAHLVAKEIEAVITPEELLLIEKVPTTSLTAYDFYQRGREEVWKFSSDIYNTEALENAKLYFYKALKYDSSFAPAYAELANIYYEEFVISGNLEEQFLDSTSLFADISLELDNQLALAHSLKGSYYYINGNMEKALYEFNKAIEFNPNDYNVYFNQGRLHRNLDNAISIYNFHKAAAFLSGSELAIVYDQLSAAYTVAGFFEYGKFYGEKIFQLDRDSLTYFTRLGFIEFVKGDHSEALKQYTKGYKIDTSDNEILHQIAWHYMNLGQFEESLIYYRKWLEKEEQSTYSDYNILHRVGYVLWQNGFKEEAKYYLNEQKEYCDRLNDLGQLQSSNKYTYYDLAGIYAFLGDREKAYENLRIFNQKENEQWFGFGKTIKNDPLFNSIRDDPEFQQIAKDVEAKCLAEHERIRKWLEENEMLLPLSEL